MKKKLAKLLFIIGINSFLNATIYENAEDSNTLGWRVYDSSPSGASISNIIDSSKGNVISLNGSDEENGYILGAIYANENEAWKNSNEKILKWKMKYSESFTIFVSLDTVKGHRYIIYTPTDYTNGLGTDANDDTWRSFTRNLVDDLKQIDDTNELLSVNGFLIRGTGLIDDIELESENPLKTVYENAEDGNTLGWRVYDATPSGASISNIIDSSKGNVISLNGSAEENGYILGAIYANENEAWKNSNEKILKWKMKYSESFTIFVSLDTVKGHRYIIYTPTDYTNGLGTDANDDTWRSFSRNLVDDLKQIDDTNELLSVNGFLIRGTGLIDDIEMESDLKSSTYLKTISLPSCQDNPEATFIETVDDFSKINNEQYRVFCIKPSLKTEEVISIERSGTEDNPLYLLLDNGNNEHPINLTTDELAKYRIEFHSSNYWIVDRLAYWEDEDPNHKMIVLYNSSHNILNRILGKDISSGISFYTGSNENIIQNSHMEKTQWSVDFALAHKPAVIGELPPYELRIFADVGAFQLVGEYPNETFKNNIITHNEVINFIDAVQLVRLGEADYNKTKHGDYNPALNGEGTIIENNYFYITPLVYTNKNGEFLASGKYSVTENALDCKFGSLNPNNPIIVKDNVMFGYRPVDNTYGDLSDNGNAMVFHYGARDIIIEDNYIFDSNKGFSIGGPKGHEHGAYNLTFKDNIFYNLPENGIYMVGPYGEQNENGWEERFTTAKNILLQNNIFAKMGEEKTEISSNPSIQIYNTEGVKIINNIFIDSSTMYFAAADYFGNLHKSRELTISDNKFYNTPLQSKEEENSIPEYAIYINNISIENSFSWDNYKNNFYLQRFSNKNSPYKIMRP